LCGGTAVAAPVGLAIAPGPGVKPGAALKFSATVYAKPSANASLMVLVVQDGAPWSSESQLVGSTQGLPFTVSFTKTFPVPSDATSGTSLCFFAVASVPSTKPSAVPGPAAKSDKTCVKVAEVAQLSTSPAPSKELKARTDLHVCSDPAATLAVGKTLSGDTGLIALSGTVCNVGPGVYAGPQPLDAYFMVYTWHPPKTPAQEGDVKTFSHYSLGPKLSAGECKNVNQTYTIPGVASWGHSAPSATSRQAVKQFVLGVEKTGTVGFSKSEDCNLSNNAAAQDVPYMEKVQ
jgi:hypothetical protein